MLQDEYYVIESENNDYYPLFAWDQPSGKYGMGKPVVVTEPVKLCLGEPINPGFEWVDYHTLPDPVVSTLLKNVLSPMDIYGIQFVPTKVHNPKDPFSDKHDYWFIHVWNRIACMDKDKSDFVMSKSGRRMWGINKLVLNEKILAMFKLNKRLIFELTESTSVLLIHQTIKNSIESVNPKGCRFFKATEWNSDKTFEK